MPNIHSFHIVLADGSERNVKAGAFEIVEGTLQLVREGSTKLKVVYAPGTWKYIETESQDDRGYPSTPGAEPKL